MVERGIFGDAIALTVGALLPIMNPFSTAPLFLSLTARMNPAKRDREALMACIYAFAILVVFLLLGAAIVDFFGISVPGIRVAGARARPVGHRRHDADIRLPPGLHRHAVPLDRCERLLRLKERTLVGRCLVGLCGSTHVKLTRSYEWLPFGSHSCERLLLRQ